MTTTSNNFGAIELTPGQHHINIVSVSHNPPSRSLPLHLPRRDLLDGSEDFNEICVPMYNASTTGDLEAAKLILDKRPELVQFSLTESYETTFHIAVLGKSYMFVQYLTSLMTKEDLEIRNGNGETCLYLVARAGNVKIAKILVEKNEGLIDIPDSREKMPLYVAALFGRHHMVEYLYNISQKMTGNFWTHQKRSCVLEKCVETDLFDVALRMVIDTPELAINGSVLRLLARKPFAFHSQGSHIHLKAILLGYMPRPEDEEIGPEDEETEALQLLRIILKDIMKLPKTKIDEITRGPPDEDAMQKYSSRVLFLATEMGNTPFVVEAIRQYPHLAHEVNDDNQSIFHVVVSHRHKGIYKLLYEKGHIRDSIITLEDKNGNNMLHLVGESARGNRLPNISGMGLRTRLELLWFKEVERMLPSHLCEKKNAAGLTPHELFIKNHKDLFSKEEKMMKQMAT
ncbi:hypothetical protein L6452_40266 [Arctium lappa]|uniref:Uncharacterized protein n=1 Tax=Arctium lappa TaxID=4217 RepID=A0ACB8XLN9_ARCLA|nr:hypothetical protein L6452_40266 [Arctium lappa]